MRQAKPHSDPVSVNEAFSVGCGTERAQDGWAPEPTLCAVFYADTTEKELFPVNHRFIAVAALAAVLCAPGLAQAQGIVRGAQDGAATGNRAAGPVGGVVGGAVGAGVGGAAGAVKGVLGIPQDTRTRHRRYRRHRR